MKKKNFFAHLAKTGLALSAALLISLGLASCSKNKKEECLIYMETDKKIDDSFRLAIGEDEGPLTVIGAELESSIKSGRLVMRYKLKAQKLVVKGNFTVFDCDDNSLTSLDLGANKGLKELWCSNNKLQKLDLSNSKELSEIRCNNNILSELKTGNNKRLQSLRCQDNELPGLDLSENTSLKELVCHGNKIPESGFKLPDVRNIGGGKLFFKTVADGEKLSKTKVGELKNDFGWKVLWKPGVEWVDYEGED